jgi:hypothetical protein
MATPDYYCPPIVINMLIPTCRQVENKDHSHDEYDTVSHLILYDFIQNCD